MDGPTQYALAYALTTTAGVRALMALAAVAVAAHAGWLHPPAPFTWLASTPAMWVLIAVAAVDLLADKIPLLDHGMHLLGIVIKPAAAVILVGGTLHVHNAAEILPLMALGAFNA